MPVIRITGIILAGLVLLALLIAFVCYRIVFFVPKRKPAERAEAQIAKGEAYDAVRSQLTEWALALRKLPYEDLEITSFDGLRLYGKFYEYAPNAPIELMFHGYRGTAERDLAGGVERCFRLGRSALLVDQRCSGKSEGNAITFGIKERKDCLCWIEFMLKHFGPQVKILLTGISMGASTVLLAAGQPLPPNVFGILADCGYTSARDIIRTVISQLHLPADLLYPFVRLGAILFAGFDPNETSPLKAMQDCSVPVIFYHGEDDAFVPARMSRQNYDACAAKKQLVLIPKAGHGLSYVIDPDTYLTTLRDFFGPEASSDAPPPENSPYGRA